jgi:hypothetical protein|tara:strand:+ start:749 stop:919 length:171 start_codon:yes stop_codon:yes gene_type:complete
MSVDGYLIFLKRFANLIKAKDNAKDRDMQRIWQNKIEEFIEQEQHERKTNGARSVY